MTKRIVYLVDNKRRDLPGAGLLAHHLRRYGIECELQPLESYRAILYAFKPDLVLINHLLATHLVQYSKNLRALGIKVGVLPNEGVNYEYSELMFNSGLAHNGSAIDLFFCWNEIHKRALTSVGFDPSLIHVTGSPRFDFYFAPWRSIYQEKESTRSQRPNILLCTNLTLAKFYELPRTEADKFFATWSKNAKRFSDYLGAVEVSYRNRGRTLEYLNALLDCDQYDVTLRLHPTENPGFYQNWASNLSKSKLCRLKIDRHTPITRLILKCDLEISLDSCTTAIDSWLAGKPTIDLELERHELLSNPMLDPLNCRCSHPEELPGLVARELSQPLQIKYQEVRKKHLEEWFGDPKGNSSERIAKIIAETLNGHNRPTFNKLGFSDIRRGVKLRIFNAIDKPYNWHPHLGLRRRLDSDHIYIKKETLDKTISPSDVEKIMQQISSC